MSRNRSLHTAITRECNKVDHFNSENRDQCEFYKNKALRLQEKYSELWDLLENLKESNNNNAELQCELVQRTTEISKLQIAISDLQVFLFREREENLRLSAENDELRIENYENNRALNVLLQLSGITSKQLSELLNIHHPKSSSRSSNTLSNDRRSKNNEEKIREPMKESLLMQVKSLKTQLENLQTLFRNEVDVLLKDREVVASEREEETKRMSEQLTKLSSNFRMVQHNLTDTVACLLQVQKEKERDEDIFNRERSIMMKHNIMDYDEERKPVLINGAGSARSWTGNSRLLQSRIGELEKLSNLYQKQCKNLDEEVKRWKDKAEKAEKLLKDKSRQLTSDLTVMRHRYEELDRRRLLEAEGFRTDIRLLRERMRELDKKVLKMKAEEAAIKNPDQDLKASTQLTLERAMQFEKEVMTLKKKFAALSNDNLS